jgi:hypothetical protein
MPSLSIDPVFEYYYKACRKGGSEQGSRLYITQSIEWD